MEVDMSFLPNGVSGEWKVETFEVSKGSFSEAISMFKYGRGVPPGTYKKLTRNGQVIMSNTPDEIRDFAHFVRKAKGHVLINGLGLGCVVKVLLENPEITKITVIEKSSDVIGLVLPHFNDNRLVVINADAFKFKPSKADRFDAVWHDIWDNICSDNLKEMTTLHRKYARKAEWQDSWAKPQCQRQARYDRMYSY